MDKQLTKTYKIRKRFFDAILEGRKTFELREISSELLEAKKLKLIEDSLAIGNARRVLTCDIGFILPLGEAQHLYDDDDFERVSRYCVISILNPVLVSEVKEKP